jgi:aminoglycoside phosphotransferase (APT) family kinase protein
MRNPVLALDTQNLTARVEARMREVAPLCSINLLEPLPGGTLGLTFSASFDPGDGGDVERIVVKVAPPGLEPRGNRDVLRQARVLRALAPTPVRVPVVLAEDRGVPPLVPPFFVMPFVEGECVEPCVMPAGTVLRAEAVQEREFALARMLGAMHRLDMAAIGLGDEPTTSLTAEVEHWTKVYATVPADLAFGASQVAELLMAGVPDPEPACLLHGDLRLGNALAVGTEVRAIIDWEIWARGDPRVDLAWFMMMAAPDYPFRLVDPPGMPSQGALLAAYLEARRDRLGMASWFHALARFKQAAVVALGDKYSRQRGTPSPNGERPPGRHPLLSSALTYLT